MTYAAQLIEQAKAAAGFATDSALARHLKVDKTTVSQWRHGKGSPMPQDRVIALCTLAGIAEEDRGYWITGIMRDAVTTTGVMRALDGVLDRIRPTLAGVGIVLVGTLAAFALPLKAEAGMQSLTRVTGCIMRNKTCTGLSPH